MSLKIRAMTPDDLDHCFTLTQALKWPHRREDWALALQLGEGTVIEEQGKLIGSAVLWRWGDSAATLGLIIVDNQQQGRGLGKQLMLAQLEKLPDCNVRLHATEMGKGLYEKLGFVSCGEIRQHQTRAVTTLPEPVIPAGLQLRPATLADHATLVTLDQQAHGMHRPALFDHLLRDCQTVLLQDDQQQIQGFASLRRFGHGWAIGPIIAGDFAVAQALVASLMQSLQGEFLRIDTDAALPMAAWLQSLGIPQVDAPTTMVRGTPWTPQGMQAFGLMTQAMA
ncbi:GNAT family N-acetyltransferase [Pantoea agglomerans]|uniref:GNAT family N-acetyltransferase n=1 Tax=Enterobacter agglomerans TaxID=549 RepID=UPI0023AF0DCF|nr:GNAT family N-acetyltransferase [Pantoea agglomerans]MDH1171305.1 GNAT family N-acetyltransferase [Pantoea agglomerans]WEC73906.1 GNAT family N-acetyltransferase [Pantoea agglomerans]